MTKHVNHTMRLIQRAGGLPADILGSAGDLSSHTSHIGIAQLLGLSLQFPRLGLQSARIQCKQRQRMSQRIMRFRGYRIGKLLIVKRGPQPAHLLVGRLSLRFGHARKGARANMQSGQCGDRHRNQGNHNGARDDRSFVDKHHHGIAIPNSGIWFGEDRMPDRSLGRMQSVSHLGPDRRCRRGKH